MMERLDGGLDWSWGHNSQFEISKLAIMDFPQPNTAQCTTLLIISTKLPNRNTTSNTISNVQTYKHLGITFDPKLNQKAHISRVTASSTK